MRIASWNDEQPTTLYQRDLQDLLPIRQPTKADDPAATPVAPLEAGSVGIHIAAARAPETSSPTENQPRQLGPYLMYERIARGSLSWVHLGCGSPRGNRKVVAIKLLDPKAASDPAVLAMFLHEARLGSRIQHPNVVRTLDLVADPEQGTIGLVTEYIYGETLSRLVRRAARLRAPLPIEHAAGIVVAALRGLQAVHEAKAPDGAPLGIVHRDLSPQNIVVGADGVVRLLDFGIATSLVQRVGPDDRRVRGKPRYMAPEQIRSELVDGRVDIFAAGVVLWELLAGRRLFEGQDAKLVWSKILHSHAPPPSRFNPAVPLRLDAVVLHALKRDREHRFAAASQFADAIMGATAIARPPAIAAWIQTIAPDLLAKQVERADQILDVTGDRRPRSGATPLARRLGQLAGLALVGVALANAAVRNNVSPADLLRSVRLRASAGRSEPTRAGGPATVVVGQLPAPPARRPAVAAQPPARGAAAPRRADMPAPVRPAAPLPGRPESNQVPAPVAPAPQLPERPEPTHAAAPVAPTPQLPERREPTHVAAPVAPTPQLSERRETTHVAAPVAPTPQPPERRGPARVAAPVAPTPQPPERRGPTRVAAPVAPTPQPPERRGPTRVAAPVAPASQPPERRGPIGSRTTSPRRIASESAARPTVLPRAAALARITDLNRQAESAYREGDFPEASRLLRTALALAATGKLTGDAQTALTHALLAAVLVKGYRQNDEAIAEFRRALLVPRFSPSPSLLDNQRLVDVYEKAVESLQPQD